jgi:hypothetical protein
MPKPITARHKVMPSADPKPDIPKKVQERLREEFGGEFRSMKAAIYAVIIALENKSGVETLLATSLRMHVAGPFEQLEKAITGQRWEPSPWLRRSQS